MEKNYLIKNIKNFNVWLLKLALNVQMLNLASFKSPNGASVFQCPNHF